MREKADWEKENIRLAESEAPHREFLRIETESASDSEILRQALRNAEQLVDDLEHGTTLIIVRRDGSRVPIVPEMFRDAGPPDEMVRRSLILHKASKVRINELRTRLGLEDISAVARFALRFLFRIVKEAQTGARFYVEDENGLTTEIRFGAFSGARERAVGNDPQVERPRQPLPETGGVLISAKSAARAVRSPLREGQGF